MESNYKDSVTWQVFEVNNDGGFRNGNLMWVFTLVSSSQKKAKGSHYKKTLVFKGRRIQSLRGRGTRFRY